MSEIELFFNWKWWGGVMPKFLMDHSIIVIYMMVHSIIVIYCFSAFVNCLIEQKTILSGVRYPQGEPWTFFWAKIEFGIQWAYSQCLEMAGSALIFTFLVFLWGKRVILGFLLGWTPSPSSFSFWMINKYIEAIHYIMVNRFEWFKCAYNIIMFIIV